ncbi:MAG: AbiV family abortive infection protein [Candidatus Odinarchaeota archaeon]
MDIDSWRDGIDICIENVERLSKDGKLLMENGSYGHACFSFITAFEEIGVAYFILANFDTPKPAKLKKFLKHHIKIAVSNLITLVLTGGSTSNLRSFYNTFSELLINGMQNEKKKQTAMLKLGKEIQEDENLWYLRNRGIYVTLNNSFTKFLSPDQIGKEQAETLKKKLEDSLVRLKVERDVYKKFGALKFLTDKEVIGLYGVIVDFSETFDMILNGSLEKINLSKYISPYFKDALTDFILNKAPIKYPELNLEVGSELEKEDFVNLIVIQLFELAKQFQVMLKKIKDPNKAMEVMQFRAERLKHYFSEEKEILNLFNQLFNLLLKKDFSVEDLVKFFES